MNASAEPCPRPNPDEDADADEVMPPADVAQRFHLVPVLRDPIKVEALTGGITNRNYKVTTREGTYVARVSSPDSALLAIDREAEHRNSAAAALSGVGAPVIDYVPAAGILVVGFIEGRTFTETDVQDPVNLPRIASACRTLHSGPRFSNEFNMFRLQEKYLAIVRERDYRLPEGYLGYAEQVAEMERAMARVPVPAVPCNNDLLAGNMVDDGTRIWLIDYEYSGNNDPYFELGNLWSESALPLPMLDALIADYVGAPSPRLVARAWLWALLSKYGWTLWASIQDGSSALDFDFWTWGMEKYDRAVSEFASPAFGRCLEEVMTEDA